MNWKLLLLGIALAGAAVLGWMVLSSSGLEPLEMTLLHTNDLHSHYDSFEPIGEPVQGGVARLATAIASIRDDEENVLLLDAGDQFQGSLYFTVGGANVVADVMNEIGYDAMVIGNHEFDSGPAELARFITRAAFPIVSSNIDASGDVDLAGHILPYEIFNFDRRVVAVIGLTSEHTAIASSPGPNVVFFDALETAQRTVDTLEGNGIDIIIALTHLGYERDLELAEFVSGIDIIVGGHSHTWLAEYPTVTTSSAGEPVLIVTASEWGKQLGRLDVAFTSDGIVDSFAGDPVEIVESIPQDKPMGALLATYQSGIDALMTTIVGASEIALNGAREDVRVRETNLGNLICDAMLWKTGPFEATIAIQNGGGIRASIPKGMITMGQVLEVLPYGNQITVLTLTGAQLVAALENGVSGIEDGAGSFPQVSGLRYTINSAAEVGSRVISVEVWNPMIGSYVDLDANGVYTVATNDFIADGGDGFTMFVDAQAMYDTYQTGWLLSDTLSEYLDVFAPVEPEIEGRITEIASEAE